MRRIMLQTLILVIFVLSMTACNTAQLKADTSSIGSTEPAPTTNGEDKAPDSMQPQTTFYISPKGSDENGNGTLESPWQSIEKARDYIRTISPNMTSDIFVYLREGSYIIEEPITFNSKDSGNNGFTIHYENYNGETPTISGGKEISGWELYDSERNIYMAKVEPGEKFRQLYINGQRAIMARTPNMGETDTAGPYYLGGKWNHLNKYESSPYPQGPYTFKIKADNVPECDQSSPLELVTVDHWRMKIARVAGFEVKGSIAITNLKSPEANNGIFAHANQYIKPVYTPYYFQNALDLLDAEGEWYLDGTENQVYYKPRANENMDSALVVAPKFQTIINIFGGSNLHFRGLTIEYSNWSGPCDYGYANWQAAIGCFVSNDRLQYLPGAIQIENVDNIQFEGCTVQHTGANGIVALDEGANSAVSNCLFESNIITDTSAGGIFLVLNNERSTGNVIQNNLVSYGGRQYADGVGILVACTPNAKILHNEVCFYRYGGISFGWEWGDVVTAASNIEVAYNKVHDVMQLLDDSAGIYSLGNIPGGLVHDNYIYNISPSDYNGFNVKIWGNAICAITNDAGSNKVIYSNVIENTGYAFSATNPPNYDNVFKR